ncbi:MAG: lamin tail domain-containing protein [Bacteroidota bacterium]|jgi:hypothetical protein
MHSITRLALFFLVCTCNAQVTQFPFNENFDSAVVPALPSGWTTTTNRSPSGDFTTTASSVLSFPNAAVSTNATVSQSLISPLLDFSNRQADSLVFHERRSGSHDSGLLIEASTDGGTNFSIQIGDTLRNPGTTAYVRRKLKLPPAINGHAGVMIRWRVAGDGTGKTGTIRFDDVTVSTVSSIDAGISAIRFAPPYPVVGDSVLVRAVVKNFGRQGIQNVPVEFYEDANGDSVPEPNELIASRVVTEPLQPNDTAVVELRLTNLTYGERTIMAQTNLPDDENAEDDLKVVVLSVGSARRSVVINEVMYAPAVEAEWVELLNTLNSDIDLKNWKLSNRNTSSSYTITNSSIILPANGYAVIAKDTALLRNFHPIIPSAVIQSPALPTYLFNNGGDAVVVFDGRGAIMDSVRYYPAWGGIGGVSLERIQPEKGSNDSTNWGSSEDTMGSTPGRKNSLTPVDYDLGVLRVLTTEVSPSSATIEAVVQNDGIKPAGNYSVTLFSDVNCDSIPQDSEMLERKASTSPLAPGDSVTFTFAWNNPPSGKRLVIVRIDFPADLKLKNNLAFDSVNVAFAPASIVINEIMYQPMPGQSEYVELFNRSAEAVNLAGWTLSDMRDKSGKNHELLISRPGADMAAGGYLVVAADSSVLNTFPNLENPDAHVVILNKSSLNLTDGGDDVILRDITGRVIDSVRYSPQWHNPNISDVTGRSLERVNPDLASNDPRNWSTCANPTGGTPGLRNSIFTASLPASVSLTFSPNPFSPDGDGFEDFTMISYRLPTSAALVRIRIYDSKGRLVRSLANGEPSGSHGQVIWDGFTDSREKARMGIYVVLLEALDAYGGTVQSTKGVVVVAAKL